MTLAANFFISTYERRQGERLNSAFLKADAAHTRSDIIVTSMSILSLVVSTPICGGWTRFFGSDCCGLYLLEQDG